MRVLEHSLIILFLVHRKRVFAFPRLTTRGDCDSFVCGPSVTDIIDGAEAIGNGGKALIDAGIGATTALFGWTINKVSGLLEPPNTGSATPNVDETHETPNDNATPNIGATPEVDNDRSNILNPLIAPDADITTPKVDNVKANVFSPTPDPVPDIEIDVIKPPLGTSDCDSTTAPPPLLDLSSNQVSDSFPI